MRKSLDIEKDLARVRSTSLILSMTHTIPKPSLIFRDFAKYRTKKSQDFGDNARGQEGILFLDLYAAWQAKVKCSTKSVPSFCYFWPWQTWQLLKRVIPPGRISLLLDPESTEAGFSFLKEAVSSTHTSNRPPQSISLIVTHCTHTQGRLNHHYSMLKSASTLPIQHALALHLKGTSDSTFIS